MLDLLNNNYCWICVTCSLTIIHTMSATIGLVIDHLHSPYQQVLDWSKYLHDLPSDKTCQIDRCWTAEGSHNLPDQQMLDRPLTTQLARSTDVGPATDHTTCQINRCWTGHWPHNLPDQQMLDRPLMTQLARSTDVGLINDHTGQTTGNPFQLNL